jgi:predicted ferric reductase
MTSQVWWYAARATGLVAWALLAASVIAGLIVSTRLARRRPTPAWSLDIHRFLGGLALAFTLLHMAGLVADSYVEFALVDLLVPLASSWRPVPVALGVVAFHLLVAAEVTSLLKRRLPHRLWRGVHLTTFALFWAATLHLLLAGSDAGHPLAAAAVDLVAVAVVFLTLVRLLAPRRAARQLRGRGGPGDTDTSATTARPSSSEAARSTSPVMAQSR